MESLNRMHIVYLCMPFAMILGYCRHENTHWMDEMHLHATESAIQTVTKTI